MARSNAKRKKPLNKLLYLIPALALVLTAVVYAVAVTPAASVPPAMDFTVQLVVQVTALHDVTKVRDLSAGGVGIAGGAWHSHQYDSYGVDASHYPVYQDVPNLSCPSSQQGACTIHVKSKVNHNYTLGDFFAAWGYPIGMNNTMGIKSNGNFTWQMCLGASRPGLLNTEFGGLVLRPTMFITLLYYDSVNGFGCTTG